MRLSIAIVLTLRVVIVVVAQQGLRSPAFIAQLHPNGPNPCASVNDSSLKGYWKLDESSGNAVDAKGANTLTDNNSVGSGAGVLIGARTFVSGANQVLSIADNAALSAGDVDFTIGAWFKYSGMLVGGIYPTIISKWESAGNREYHLTLNGDSQRVEFSVSADGTASSTTVVANNAGDPPDNTWHYVIAWHDATANTINIQVDGGTPDTAAHSTGVFDGTGVFTLGAIDTAGAFALDGSIDEAFLTKRVLTGAERTALYSLGNGCRPEGL